MTAALLRLLQPDDDRMLAAMHAACFRRPWPAEAFSLLLRQSECFGFLFEDNLQQPLGFILGRVVLDEAEILSLGVLPPWTGQGCGKALVAGFLEALRAREVQEAFLEVSEGNLPARSLYNKFGFNICGRRENYYKEGEFDSPHALIIRKKL
ncbi:MAG: ribosomal protein S18-alanine N-acetyltransferase [Holosporales bacterium]